MKIKFGGYYSMPLDFDSWSKEEQQRYTKIGIEDGWLEINPSPIRYWFYRIKEFIYGK